MRKICLVLLTMFLCATSVDVWAVARNQNTTISQSRQSSNPRNEILNRSVSVRNTANTATKKTSARNTTSNKTVIGRNEKTNTARNSVPASRISRAATTVATRTFGSNYNTCRDAYFTCMDQFCATQNETYRRCVCSSKLKDIQKQEQLLSQTSDNLKDFENFNIEMISKTTNEVKSMLSASAGESSIKKDKSDSAKQLQNISSVLNKSKQESLSTQGKLDIGGDIKSIWTTTNLIGGSDIANLTGEELFNAVHTQCYELVYDACAESDLKMVSTAYGMYIENDCSLIENNLNKQKTTANAAIRQTRHKMQDTRLENYNAHNSVSINDCIHAVRNDILTETACGPNYVHCLDFSGKYLNSTTGKPIYSPDFYQIENQISLSGDILQNGKNSNFIYMLNQKRSFAEKDLQLCSDNADEVWNEFMRQALVEIYQQQKERVKTVKEECLQVVNECYANKTKQLKGLTDDSDKINLAQTLELSEELCAEKLNTCSNLYGGGPQGLEVLIATMTTITDMTITQSCSDSLMTFAKNICRVDTSDSKHSYPYGCRKYAPGESRYARKEICNSSRINPFSRSEIVTTNTFNEKGTDFSRTCLNLDYKRKYLSCKPNYYLYCEDDEGNGKYCPDSANACMACPSTKICTGGTAKPLDLNKGLYNECGEYYIGSLYQQFAIYAIQNCTRPSKTSYELDEELIMEIDETMRQVRTSIISVLKSECEAYNGIWSDIPWTDNNSNGYHDYNGDTLKKDFYENTGSNTLWGYCH